jgi:hypothetical protein
MPTLAQIYEEHAKECTRSAAKTDTSAMIRATGGFPVNRSQTWRSFDHRDGRRSLWGQNAKNSH